MGKPRTITGRVACRMVDALEEVFRRINVADFEYVLMLGAAQASQQGLAPEDFDNDKGIDAFTAIFTMLVGKDEELIRVTPEWRRVVISARRHTPRRDGERSWRWRASGDATAVRMIQIPGLASSS